MVTASRLARVNAVVDSVFVGLADNVNAVSDWMLATVNAVPAIPLTTAAPTVSPEVLPVVTVTDVLALDQVPDRLTSEVRYIDVPSHSTACACGVVIKTPA